MRKNIFSIKYTLTPENVTKLVLHGSLFATVLTTSLLVLHDKAALPLQLKERGIITVSGIIFLFCIEFLLYKKYTKIVNVVLILFYEILAAATLLIWGLNSPAGLLIASFAVILPGILIAARAILPATIITLCMISAVYLTHQAGYIKPEESIYASAPSTHWDVFVYAVLFITMAFTSWLSVRLHEMSLRRAHRAETALRVKRDELSSELGKESAALRHEQLRQIHQLHKFALLGQTTAATLHELSNHLSVLNLDIDDLRQHHSNSQAIANATEGIKHINRMVRQARRRLNTYENEEKFNAISLIQQTIKDFHDKFSHHNIKLTVSASGKSPFIVSGSTMALMQVITVLLNNALEACLASSSKAAHVHVSFANRKKSLDISIIDTGIGISAEARKKLFQPMSSTKPAGLGVGLFIARHLTKAQFNGTIQLRPTKIGTHFIISLPTSP